MWTAPKREGRLLDCHMERVRELWEAEWAVCDGCLGSEEADKRDGGMCLSVDSAVMKHFAGKRAWHLETFVIQVVYGMKVSDEWPQGKKEDSH